jgi:hypothetical protein
MQSESVIAVAPAAANTWTAVGTITVPAGVKSLKKVKIGVAPDPGVAAATLHLAPVFRLLGSGLLEQSPHQYVAQGADLVLIAATTSLVAAEPDIMIYDVDIPVQTGGTIDIQELSIAEAVPGTCRAELVFSPDEAGGINSMSDYVTAVMPTAAGAWTAVGTLTVPQLGEGKNPKRIKRVDCGLVNDNLGAVTSLRTSARFRISGSGVAEGGNHHFLGNQNSGSNVVTGSGYYSKMIVTHLTDIPVNPGGQILVESIMDTELTDGGDMVFGVLYG